MKLRKLFLLIFLSLLFLFHSHCAYAIEWLHLKDKHFIVYYNLKRDELTARRVLRKAESYYNKIAAQIGYTRCSNFWTWDEGVKIIVFPNKKPS